MRVCELLEDLKDCPLDANLMVAVPDAHSGHVLELESVVKEQNEPVVIFLARSMTERQSPAEAPIVRDECALGLT